MRILHSADWHIGRQFHNVSLLEDQRYVLDQLVAMIAERAIDVLLVAGDIYDRSVPPAAAVALLDDVLHRICNELKVPVIMIAGNHDGAERLGFAARHLAGGGLHIIGPLQTEPSPVLLHDCSGPVLFYGLPYADPATAKQALNQEIGSHDAAMAALTDQVWTYHQSHHGGQRAVLLAHCFVQGGEVSESERPLSIGGAEQVSGSHFRHFDYVALGHLHGRQYRGREAVRYSGSILKYSFSEQNHIKSVTCVEMDAAGGCIIEQLPLVARRDMRVIEGALDDIIHAATDDPGRDDYLLVRLTDRHAILDAMGKLRAAYPNVMHLERPGLMTDPGYSGARRDQLQRGELAMFSDFFQQVSGREPDAAQRELVAAVLQKLHHSEES